jgi:hypothetical protein
MTKEWIKEKLAEHARQTLADTARACAGPY